WNACAIFYEPLIYFNGAGDIVPVLAQEVPSLQNGGVAKDGTSVTWKLKRGVSWHDGKPFTASDVVFNWEYTADPATAAPGIGTYKNVKQVEALDPSTVKVTFTQPTPFWNVTFQIIPRHIFEPYKGAKSREAPNNLKPVGTGPYRFVEFKPGDLLKGEMNPNYHVPGRPFFDAVEVKGGGDAVSAARAVLQTGEYDYASGVGGVEGGGRRPPGAGAGGEGTRGHRLRRPHPPRAAQPDGSVDRGGRRAIEREDGASFSPRPRREGRPRPPRGSHGHPGADPR